MWKNYQHLVYKTIKELHYRNLLLIVWFVFHCFIADILAIEKNVLVQIWRNHLPQCDSTIIKFFQALYLKQILVIIVCLKLFCAFAKRVTWIAINTKETFLYKIDWWSYLMLHWYYFITWQGVFVDFSQACDFLRHYLLKVLIIYWEKI